MVWIQKHLYSWPIFSLKGLHQEVLSGVPWCLQVTKTSLCSVWFLPCNNVTVLKPLFYAEWVTTAYRSPSSMSASWNLHRWKHYLQKFPKSLACKISWPESMWFLAVRIRERSCLPRTCSISGCSEDEHTATFCSDSTRTAVSNNSSRHFTDAACSRNLWCTYWKHFVTSWEWS